ncbi:MAG: hypothetical protein A3C90_04125 [Candidatus Magasanikbacteria bacterium RIFCSPHIGHO2_02_FULL_51_14]|uniref:Peptidase C39-like domain-containing protein n=1 Tax=Candidatus Magasanikbacteria bacterium RIFCSPHIGHO2_02_FULL_51_14 TaxID=1798683 RepID=A0A1F6MFN5_9BACT|nr:MAG: hypothetical protein A3C90_04125 [Candidatus Magasanikbacteria bacterium RIFCSPHIGHO2_02_FULL_51_14]
MKPYVLIALTIVLFTPTIATASTTLSFPFTSQAPFGDWSEPWHNACEEATILMVDFEYADKPIDPEIAREQLLKIFRIKNNAFGMSYDENAEQIARIVNDFFPWEARVIEGPSLDDLKYEIDGGRPVIVPVYGRALENPYFTNGGPVYHTVILSGYDDAAREFITQDPGTRRGQDFRYSFDTIFDAMHDFVPNGGTPNGPKVVIYTTKSIRDTEFTDADNDGLGKRDEMKYGTILYLADSDGDGMTDGEEVKRGFIPTLAENKLPSGTLIKTSDDARVYLLENGEKRHIVNETVFFAYGWRFQDVIAVSETFLNSLKSAEQIIK